MFLTELREQLAVFVASCVVVAVTVAWWPKRAAIVRVETADERGICVRHLDTDERDCIGYTPEFPSEARYRQGECLELTEVYRADVPPHADRISCPA
jgi:hypothetical protein